MADSSPPQLSRVTSRVISWKRIGGNLRRWLADLDSLRRAVHPSADLTARRNRRGAEERILAVWKLRNTAGKSDHVPF